ncbi:MAG TPA: MtrB/PioB family outer membrane beta-barrel protein [Thermoanaerobaculia bacterium]|nr:MtrB/PioB family outer membrane beta-barrel protein [Thermoanaerobaculia bacterium]
MKRAWIFFLLVVVAVGLYAQTPPEPEKPPVSTQPGPEAKPPETTTPPEETIVDLRRVDFGVQGVSVDSNSSRFNEYRDVPKEPVLPSFRILGVGNISYTLTGENVARADQRYTLGLSSDFVNVTADYNQIPHRFGLGRTLEQPTSRGTYEISDALQQVFQNTIAQQFATNRAGVNFAFLNALVTPSLAVTTPIDVGLLRKRGFFDFRFLPERTDLDSHVTYFVESRSGNRGAGTSFGFGNGVETPEPINYMTRDVGVSGEYLFGQALVRGAVHVNDFHDTLVSYTFDNPFRITSATDASAYTAPASGSIGGAAFGRLSLPPSNSAVNANVGLLYKLPANSRLTVDVGVGRWKQDERLIPYTTNTAITAPLNASDINTLPVNRFDGKISTDSEVLTFSSRPIPGLSINARYRRNNRDNNSPRVTLPGYVRFDAVWEDIPRITVPYSVRTNRGELYGSYDFKIVTVEAGFRNEQIHRTFRETDRTNENVWHVAADFRPMSWAVVRTTYEFGSRDFNEYDFERSEDASFVNPGPPAQLPALRRFDQAAKDINRLVTMLQLTPLGGNASFSVSYLHNLDKYTKSTHGLLRWKNDSFNAEADYTPSDRWSAFGFYSWENFTGFQRGRQSGASPSTNPLDDWTANNSDKANTFGIGGTVGLIPEKLDLHLLGRYQKVNGVADLFSPPGGTPDIAVPIPNVDDTKLWTTSAELTYRFTKTVDLAVGGWIEKYTISDAQSTSLANFVPGSFFLAANDGDYRGNVAYVRATYHW